MVWERLSEHTGPRRLREALDQLADRLRTPSASVLRMVFDNWDELVGSVIAQETTPVRLVDGELVVAVDDPAWATEMRFFGAELMERINAVAGKEAVTTVTVRVRRR
ncbi:DciA family protein [Candidatus Poriferisocius sp.]|uniref:DciA family protein n=1 Tax=Candidatus Poriferisocius sp. TaxID=3101276 RepID=UPI003B5CC1E9